MEQDSDGGQQQPAGRERVLRWMRRLLLMAGHVSLLLVLIGSVGRLLRSEWVQDLAIWGSMATVLVVEPQVVDLHRPSRLAWICAIVGFVLVFVVIKTEILVIR
jgi:hypothetical protein